MTALLKKALAEKRKEDIMNEHRCDWCYRKTTTQCGLYVDNKGNERSAWKCRDIDHISNPVFQSAKAFLIWKKKHPRLAWKYERSGHAW